MANLPDLNALALPTLFAELVDARALRLLLSLARDEDLGQRDPSAAHSVTQGDITSLHAIQADAQGRAVLRSRAAGTVAGLAALPAVIEVFEASLQTTVHCADGSGCTAGAALVTLEGNLRDLLALERTLLNLLSRLCGIATVTSRCVDAVVGTGVSICDTRKTTPGLRTLEKYAVRCGGGTLHRIGLFDAVLLKDNHLAGLAPRQLAELSQRVAAAARAAGPLRFVEVEVDSLEQFASILELPPGTVDIVLLDNMAPDMLRRAVALRGPRRDLQLEASGGITMNSLRAVAECGVERISLGALTHSAGILDLGLDIGPDLGPDLGPHLGIGGAPHTASAARLSSPATP